MRPPLLTESSAGSALSANRIKRAAGSLTENLGFRPFRLGVRLGPRGLLLHQSLQLSSSRIRAERQAPGLRADRELPSSDVSPHRPGASSGQYP